MTVMQGYCAKTTPSISPPLTPVAIGYLPSLVRVWCPQGRMCGHEWQAFNPTRHDKRPGSFCINAHTGKWADFATGDRGGDPVLGRFRVRYAQVEAGRTLATTLGVKVR